MKKTFSEEQAYEIIDAYYKNDETFRLIARNAVKRRIDRGIEIDQGFVNMLLNP